MKAIIDGIRYDTEKAEAVASYSNGLGRSDFRFIYETLFLTCSGRWFLAGEGGPMTEYAKKVADGRMSGDSIRPLDRDAALAWLELRREVEAIERHFADDIVDA